MRLSALHSLHFALNTALSGLSAWCVLSVLSTSCDGVQQPWYAVTGLNIL